MPAARKSGKEQAQDNGAPPPGSRGLDTPVKVALLTAGLALAGTLTSGYIQYSRYSDQYSVERAELFRGLFTDLLEEDRGSLALLVLWQLYPREKEKIVIAALETGQPEIIDTLMRLDQELTPYTDTLYLYARSDDSRVSDFARKVLFEVSPPRGAEILLRQLDDAKSINLGSPDVSQLIALARGSTAAQGVVRSAYTKGGRRRIDLEYVLYRTAGERAFVDRFAALGKGATMEALVDFGSDADFDRDDRKTVADNVAGYLVSLSPDDPQNKYEITYGLMMLLQNPALRQAVERDTGEGVADFLLAVAGSEASYDLSRANAVTLLERIAPGHAIFAVGRQLDALEMDAEGLAQAKRTVRRLSREIGPRLLAPPPDDAPAAVWRDWLDRNEPILLGRKT